MMLPFTKHTLAVATNFLHLANMARGEQPFSFYKFIAEDFFSDNKIEASGLDIAPDGSHLVVASDNGKLIFLNLADYTKGHCLVDIDKNYGHLYNGDTDFEGLAFDPTIWSDGDMHVYVVDEGEKGSKKQPALLKISYQYDNNGKCDVTAIYSQSLKNAIPCLETSNGIESLALKSASTENDPAVFFVGVQDTGKIYEVTSEASSNGPNCYDGGSKSTDISASYYIEEEGHLWSLFDDRSNELVVVDPFTNRQLAKYETDWNNEEGLVIDYANNVMYIASDEGRRNGDSYVAVYNFTYPEGIGGCADDGADYTVTCGNNLFGCGSSDKNPVVVRSTCPQSATTSQATPVTSTSTTTADPPTTDATTTTATTTTATTTTDATTTDATTTDATTTDATTTADPPTTDATTTAATTTTATTTADPPTTATTTADATTTTATAKVCVTRKGLCSVREDCCGRMKCKGSKKGTESKCK